jgi:DNA-binding CsgD family transcriptional regulator
MNAPGRDRFAKLTQAQLSCLRLVNQHKNSKEIAIHLGVSHYTVDQRVARACKLLGVQTRWEAARLLAEHEAGLGYEPFVYEPSDIAGADMLMPPLGANATEEEQSSSGQTLYLSDTVIGFDHEASGADLLEKWSSQFSLLFSPAKWGQPNALSITNRLIAAFAILSASIIITALLIAALEGLSRLLG